MDIYFNDNYGKLYESVENGRCMVFNFECEYGKVKHQFILRNIDNHFNDIVTPYGYGGPVIIEATDKQKLVESFGKNFSEFCKENNVVSEFVRFHPIVNNVADFTSLYNCQKIRNTLGTNLRDYEDPIQSEFAKSCRKKIRQVLKQGVEYKIFEKPESLDDFINIYYSTMDRNSATDYYYFDKEYFDNCIKYFKENIILVEAIYEEKIIAAGFYFIWDKVVHIHLSGTLTEYLHLSPAYILRYAVAEWAKAHGYDLIHHGGGKSNSPDDSLFKFKKQFAANTEFDFCVGKRIWDEEAYKYLCKRNHVSETEEFFPAYRKIK